MPVTLAAKLASMRVPVFLRKIDKRSHWGHETDSAESRIATASADVFKSGGQLFSLFRVADDEQFYRIVVGLNARRASLAQQIDFVAFTESEIVSAQIELLETEGETECVAANRLHVDASPMTSHSISQLCQEAFAVNRQVLRITKSEASEIVARMEVDGCKAVVRDAFCECVRSPS